MWQIPLGMCLVFANRFSRRTRSGIVWFGVQIVEVTMESSTLLLEPEVDLDPIEEIRLRTWARRNYTSESERDLEWHPVILDEMRRKDEELEE